MIRHRHPLFIVLVALSLVSLFATSGCAPPGVHRKIRGTVRELAEREIGPADKYEVHTSRDSLRSLNAGRLSLVRVRGVNVRPAPGYVLDEIVLEGRDVKVNRRAQTVESAASTVVTGWIGEANMADMLANTGMVKGPAVRITEEGVEVRGRYELGGALPMEVMARGRLTVIPPASVTFTADRVTAAGLPLPIPLSHTIDFRPIFDALLLDTVTTEPGRVILTGSVDWTRFGQAEDGARASDG